MATDVIMPQMGESIAEGTVTKWLKQIGDTVEQDEPLFEISTDKVDAEIPSPAAGTLLEILAPEGETVEIKSVVARIGTGEPVAAVKPPPAPSQESAAPPEPPPTSPAPAPPQPAPPTPVAPAVTPPTPAPPVSAPSAPAPAAASPATPSREERVRTKSSPVVRKIAAEHGIDITQLQGSGVHGRVTKQDILTHIDGREPAPSVAPAASPPGALGSSSSVPSVGGADRVEPMSRMRQIIAEHMVASRQTSAHVHTIYEVDMSRVDALRRKHKARFLEQTGTKLTYTVFVAKAVVDALRAMPVVNASIQGSDVIYHGDVNMGIAVSLDWGLIVPVIRQAQNLSMEGIAKAITDLAQRARDRKLLPDEIAGSTFTITNPGSYGGLVGMPIINQPNVAILGMGKVEKRVCVVDDMIAIRPKMYACLGYDHRLIDGATAEQFLGAVTATLEGFDETAL